MSEVSIHVATYYYSRRQAHEHEHIWFFPIHTSSGSDYLVAYFQFVQVHTHDSHDVYTLFNNKDVVIVTGVCLFGIKTVNHRGNEYNRHKTTAYCLTPAPSCHEILNYKLCFIYLLMEALGINWCVSLWGNSYQTLDDLCLLPSTHHTPHKFLYNTLETSVAYLLCNVCKPICTIWHLHSTIMAHLLGH